LHGRPLYLSLTSSTVSSSTALRVYRFAPRFPVDVRALRASCWAFRVQSIYQGGKTLAESEFPVFAGFFGGFLEWENEADTRLVYVLGFFMVWTLLVVVVAQVDAIPAAIDNRSTMDGTEVPCRRRK
jgi:hypothetical protein